MHSVLKGQEINWENLNNLYEYFLKNTLIEDNKNDLAVIYEDKKLTYEDLYNNIIKISNCVFKKINDKNDKQKIIGLHLSPDLHLIPIMLAIHRLSCSYVPLDHNLPFERVKYILDDAELDCIITNASDYEYLKEIKPNLPFLHIDEVLKSNFDIEIDSVIENLNRSANSIACVIYTSGSTGKPKGVCLNHKSIMNRLEWQWQEFPIVKGVDFGIQKTSLNFVDHIAEIFAFILKGLPLLIVNPSVVSNVPLFVETMYQHEITYLIVVPSLLNNIINYVNYKSEEYKLKSIKRWVCSGEVLNYKTLEAFFNINLDNAILSNFYGSTEVTADVTFFTFKSKNDILPYKNSHIPIGTPISNSNIEVLDHEMNHVNLGETGEIYAIGSCLMHGFLRKSETDIKFLSHDGKLKFKTGDYGYISDNKLFYVGRKDTQIKIRGNRVDLNEIENTALKISFIDQFIPLVYENEENKRIIGFYKIKKEVLLNEKNDVEKLIYDTLKASLYSYMLPSQLVQLNDIPYLYNGKIDKISLLKLYETKFFNHIKNTDESLCQIIGIIDSITNFKIKSNDLNLSLNQIGVDSLNMLNIFLLMESNGIKIDFNEFLSASSLKELINLCEKSTRENELKDEIKNRKPCERAFYENTKFGRNLEIIKFSERSILAEEVLRMCSQTYTKKSELEMGLGVSDHEFYQELYPIAYALRNSEESFGVVDKETGKLVGGAIICDISLQFNLNEIKMKPIFALIDETKNNTVKKLLDQKQKLLYSMLVTTSIDCSINENVILIDLIESEIINVAKKFGYNAIVTVNTIKITGVRFKKV